MVKRLTATILLALSTASMALIWGGCGDESVSPDPLRLRVTPDAVIREIPFGINPPAQWVVVTTEGSGQLSYTTRIAGGSNWLRLFGQTSGPAPDSFLANISVGSLQAGVYYDTIWVEALYAENSPLAIPVMLTLTNAVAVEPDSILFLTVSGEPNPEPQELVIAGVSTTPYDFTLAKTASWMTLSATAGTSPDTIIVSADIQSLEPGVYYDTIKITAPLAEAPINVPCRLVVASWVRSWITGNEGTAASHSLRGLHFTDAQTGFAAGLLTGGEVDGEISRSLDGGTTWPSGERVIFDPLLGDITFTDELHGWAVGQTIVYTVNGGDTWNTAISAPGPFSLNHVSFVDSLFGWAVGNAGRILATNDGGKNWADQTSGVTDDLKGVYFLDAAHGWVVGNNGAVLLTADTGKTWADVGLASGLDLWCVVFVNATTGWIFGETGTILHTTNGGQSWLPQTPPTTHRLAAAAFVSPTRGWAVGTGGTILYTEDGETWSVQPSGVTEDLSDVFFIDEDEGWICADKGILLHTTGGGL